MRHFYLGFCAILAVKALPPTPLPPYSDYFNVQDSDDVKLQYYEPSNTSKNYQIQMREVPTTDDQLTAYLKKYINDWKYAVKIQPKTIENFLPGGDLCKEPIRLKNRIGNGYETKVDSRPYLAVLVVEKGKSGCGLEIINDKRPQQFCGGNIISQYHVLTAAHCLAECQSVDDFVVYAGTDNIRTPNIIKRVLGMYSHDKYDSPRNDIALLRVDTKFEYSPKIKPICLPQHGSDVRAGAVCVISGFGKYAHFVEDPSDHLLTGSVVVSETKKCKTVYSDPRIGLTITPGLFCAEVSKKKIDACQGDSGGPFACKNQGKYYLFGLITTGPECLSDVPGLYTSVSKYLKWIEDVVNIWEGARNDFRSDSNLDMS